MKITAVIMCSGLSRRMGSNKLLMPFNGRKIYEYVLDTVLKCDFYKVIAVTAYDEIGEKYRGIDVVFNPDNEEGISSSIRLGVKLSGNSDAVMFFTADQPCLDVKTVKRLMAAFEERKQIIVPAYEGKTQNPVIFPIKYKDDLLSLKGDNGGKKVYSLFYDDVYEVPFDTELPFFDIDTEDDLIRLKNMT